MKYDFFWEMMKLCDWRVVGDDRNTFALAPVVEYLSEQEDEIIFKFENQMAELLFALDSKKRAEQMQFCSDDGFLYARCGVLIKGEKYYNEILLNQRKMGPEEVDEVEELLYVPFIAWDLKHPDKDYEDYPNTPPVNYATGSNEEAWT